MKVEIELPEIEGFEYTGDFRHVKIGEYFLNTKFPTIYATLCDETYGSYNGNFKRHILRKVGPVKVPWDASDFDRWQPVYLKKKSCSDRILLPAYFDNGVFLIGDNDVVSFTKIAEHYTLLNGTELYKRSKSNEF